MISRLASACLILLALVVPASAADWVATKLRGTADIELEKTWTPLQRGDVVPENQLVRTGPESRLELSRGAEVIALGPETEVRIETDLAKSFTVVHQGLGTVDIEAEVKAVEHLEVRNKFLSAVVKGTIFSVTADEAGASVSVERGLVAVQSSSSHQSTSVPAGNSAFVRDGGALSVAGKAPPPVFAADGTELPQILPATAPAPAATGSDTESSPTQVADLGMAGGVQSPGALLLTTDGVARGTSSAAPPSGIDIGSAAMGIVIGIFIGAVALLARRFFA